MRYKLWLAMWGCMLLAACQNKQSTSGAADITRTHTLISEVSGDTLDLHTTCPKVMALTPALTEILYEVFPDSQIVAVTHTCNYPPAAKAKKTVVTTYPFDVESIVRARPELIVTEEGMTSTDHIIKLNQDFAIPTWVVRYRKLSDIPAQIRQLAPLSPMKDVALAKADSLDAAFAKLASAAKKDSLSRPNVLVLISTDALYCYGKPTLMSEIIQYAGGQNAIKEWETRGYPELSRDYLRRLDPDIIFTHTPAEFETMVDRFPEMKDLKAYRNRQYFGYNDDWFSRPGPRSLLAAQYMQAICQKWIAQPPASSPKPR